MIAIEGIWFCKKCKKATTILYIDVEVKDGVVYLPLFMASLL